MQPMKGKWASSRVDLGYTELFFLLEVTSVFWSSDSVLGDSLVFHHANRDSLCFCLGTGDCSAGKAGESSLISGEGDVSRDFSNYGRNLGYILELRRG